MNHIKIFCFNSNSEDYAESTRHAQLALFTLNHPIDCTRSPLLVCSTLVRKFQGTGSRLFFLGRCLAEGLNSARTVILSRDLESTLDMLQLLRLPVLNQNMFFDIALVYFIKQ